MKSCFIAALAGLSALLAAPTVQAAPNKTADPSTYINPDCTYARDYIMTLEFLRDRKEFGVPEAQARKLAETVSKGCSGAAERFIRITLTLTKVGVTTNDAIKTALEFAQRTDTDTAGFLSIFEYAYLADYLDLDLQSALKLARSLTVDFNGDVEGVRDDFLKLVDFCMNNDGSGFEMPKPRCADFAVRLARRGQRWSGGIAEPFVDAFKFGRSPKGLGLTSIDALRLAQELVDAGPGSSENFMTAYHYALAKRGLGMSVREAVAFAHELTFANRSP